MYEGVFVFAADVYALGVTIYECVVRRSVYPNAAILASFQRMKNFYAKLIIDFIYFISPRSRATLEVRHADHTSVHL